MYASSPTCSLHKLLELPETSHVIEKHDPHSEKENYGGLRRKRLQVFVSSTFSDLKAERQAAVEAILSAGHIPAGMELFTAGDESQMEVIKQWIDESDVYLLILGGRYGSVELRTGKSYTQLEYEYAIEISKPMFACVVTDRAHEDRVKMHGMAIVEADNPQKLREFKSIVLTRLVKFWDDFKDIKIAVGETLSQFARRDDMVGWVRPTHVADMPALADEIARLSKENAILRMEAATNVRENASGEIPFQDMRELLEMKGLLNFLAEKRLDMGSDKLGRFPSSPEQERLFQELTVLGITEANSDSYPTRFLLSDAGRNFLNRLEIENLPSRKGR